MDFKKFIIFIFFIILLTSSVSADEIILKNGQRYSGKLLSNTLRIKNEYTELSLETGFILKLDKREEGFYISLRRNNHYLAQLLSEIEFKTNGKTLLLTPEELRSLTLSSTNQYSLNHDLTLTTINDDFFSANLVEERIRFKTELNAAVEIKIENIISIERLKADRYQISLRDGREFEAEFAQESIILWPLAADLIKFDLNYLKRIVF